jgi:hypothetical protein
MFALRPSLQLRAMMRVSVDPPPSSADDNKCKQLGLVVLEKIACEGQINERLSPCSREDEMVK